ncbi:LLM class flavin-dependent oxidoreductase [Geomicrobium sp. JCM 19055]|uniref:LLM class flavin-dependent oxidoreductase n=1 Tax=Geomicrobium sp. JCM 19055 TaxID=1460649 RepID=UPI00069449BB|nr:LLM class flavin-dependent oxidoreductase [Geomicrobium sp. JCM 19055]
MQLGILDQMPTPKNLTAEQTVQHTLSLVELAEGWGYSSYWFAEHHGTKGMASSSPEIMMAAAASRTKQIQVAVAEFFYRNIAHTKSLLNSSN